MENEKEDKEGKKNMKWHVEKTEGIKHMKQYRKEGGQNIKERAGNIEKSFEDTTQVKENTKKDILTVPGSPKHSECCLVCFCFVLNFLMME